MPRDESKEILKELLSPEKLKDTLKNLDEYAKTADKAARKVARLEKASKNFEKVLKKLEKKKLEIADPKELEKNNKQIARAKKTLSGWNKEQKEANKIAEENKRNIDDLTKSYKNNTEAGKELTRVSSSFKNKLGIDTWNKATQASSKNKKSIESLKTSYKGLTKQLDEVEKKKDALRIAIAEAEISGNKKAIGELIVSYDNLYNQSKKITDQTNAVEVAILSLSNKYDQSEKYVKEYVDKIRELEKYDVSKVTEKVDPKVWQDVTKYTTKSSEKTKELQRSFEESTKKYNDNINEIRNLNKELSDNKKLTDDQKESIQEQIYSRSEENKTLSESIEKYKQFIDTAINAAEKEEELARGRNILKKITYDAKQEQKSFAGGLGGTATGALAAGVAIVYLGTKLKELGDNVVDAQKKWAEYNVELAKVSRAIPDFGGGVAGLDDLRKQLRLTRDEALGFSKVLVETSTSGVITTSGIIKAAQQLADTFGGDPTEKVREFVGLLKEIPTLDTDLNITASVDKQTAAWFALAERGKVQQVIELQAAGILGAEEAGLEGNKTEIETLKSIRQMNTLQENIEKGITSFIPSWTAYVTKSAGIALSTLGVISGVANYAVIQTGLLSQIAANTGTSAISNAVGGGVSKSIGGKIAGLLTRKIGTTAAVSGAAGGVGAGAGGVTTAASAITGATTATVGVLGTVTAGLGAFAAGLGAVALGAKPLANVYEWVADQVSEDGTNLGKGLAWLNEHINPVGVALKAFGVSTEDAYRAVAKGLNYVSDYWEDVGIGIKEYLFVSEKEKNARRESAIQELKKAVELRKVNKELRKTQKSALALEKALGYIKSATESPITELAKLSQEVASLSLDNLKYAGGNVDDFNDALKQGVNGLNKELSLLNDAYSNARRMIMKDADLTSQMKRAAMLKLNKAELEGIKKYVSGILSMVGRFDDISEIAKNIFNTAMKNLTYDIRSEIGSDLFGDSVDLLMEGFDSATDSLLTATGQFGKEMEFIGEIPENIAKVTKVSGKDFNDAIDKITKNIKDSGGDMSIVDAIKGSIDPKSLKLDTDIKVLDKSKLEDALKKTEMEMMKLDIKSAELNDNGLLENLKKQEDLYEAQTKITADAKNTTNELNKEIGKISEKIAENVDSDLYGEWDKNLQEVLNSSDLIDIKVNKLRKSSKKVADDNASSGKYIDEIAKKMAEREKALDEQNQQNENQKNLEKDVNNTKDEIIDWVKKNTDIEKSGITDRNKLLEYGKKEISQRREQNNLINTQLTNLESRKQLISKMLAGTKTSVTTAEAMKKETEALAGEIKNWLSQMDKLLDAYETSSTVQKLKRQLDIATKEREYREELGTSGEAYIKEWKKQLELYGEQERINNNVLANLKLIGKGGEARNKALDSIAKDFNITKENVQKAFKDFGDIDKKPVIDQISGIQNLWEQMNEAFKKGDEDQAKALGKQILGKKEEIYKALDDAVKKSGGKLDVSAIKGDIEGKMTSAIAIAEGLPKGMEKATATAFEFKKMLISVGGNFEAFREALRNTPLIKSTKEIMDEADAMFDLADTLGDSQMASEALIKGQDALRKNYEAELASIEQQIAGAEFLRNEKMATAKDDFERLKIQAEYEKNIADINKQRSELEINRIKKSSGWAQRAIDAESRILDLRQQEVDIQREVLDTVGASIGLIMENQSRDLALAKEKAVLAKKAYEIAEDDRVTGAELESKRLEYVRASAEVAKKSMQLQRDAYDKIMDKAFGAIRGERGARKQLLTKAQMFGTGYVQQASTGLVVPGASKTLGKAALEKQIGAAGAMRGGLKPEEKQLSAADKQLEAADKMLGIPGEIQRVLGELGPAIRTAVEKTYGGFKTGGYTGDGDKDEAAGVVHKGEYVVKAKYAKKYADILNKINKGEEIEGYAKGGSVDIRWRGTDEEREEARNKMAQEMNAITEQKKKMNKEEYDFKVWQSKKAEREARDQKEWAKMAQEANTPTEWSKNQNKVNYEFEVWKSKRPEAKKLPTTYKEPSRTSQKEQPMNKSWREIDKKRMSAIREQPITKAPVEFAQQPKTMASSQAVNVNAHVTLKVDAEGNIKAMVRKVVQEMVPQLIRSDPNVQNALANKTPVKGMV